MTSSAPISEKRLCKDLEALGIFPGMTLIVHSSLSSMGWVLGGAPTVVKALLEALGPEGTLTMPAATPQCAAPATWAEPRVPAVSLDQIRDELPIFEPSVTPTTLGAIPECFRTWPGTLRSVHPLESVCANGPASSKITDKHPMAFSEGVDGPFGRLRDLDSWILLLGVGFNRCTALHHAESLVAKRRTMKVRFASNEAGRRTCVEVMNVADDNDTHFPVIGERYVAAGRVKSGGIGDANATLFPMRDVVDFAIAYMHAAL
jgi:aminoglycoside 3-N-acetyltransferase